MQDRLYIQVYIACNVQVRINCVLDRRATPDEQRLFCSHPAIFYAHGRSMLECWCVIRKTVMITHAAAVTNLRYENAAVRQTRLLGHCCDKRGHPKTSLCMPSFYSISHASRPSDLLACASVSGILQKALLVKACIPSVFQSYGVEWHPR